MEGTDQTVDEAGGKVSTTQSLHGVVVSQNPLATNILRMYTDENLKSLCDLIIVVEEKECHAHRAILASTSPVFQSMFTNGMKESNPLSYPQKVELPEVSYDSCKNLLQFLYSGEVLLNNGESSLELLQLAHKYQFDDLVSSISKFLITNVTTENALELYNCCTAYEMEELENACYACLEKHFEEVHTGLDYAQCTKSLIYRLLRSTEIELVSEVTMLRAAIRWIETHLHDERDEALLILQYVRVDRMSLPELIEAGAFLARHEMNSPFCKHVMERMVTVRSSDTLSCVSARNRSYLMRSKRSKNPFTFAQTFSGVANAKASRISSSTPNVELKGKWIKDPTEKFFSTASIKNR